MKTGSARSAKPPVEPIIRIPLYIRPNEAGAKIRNPSVNCDNGVFRDISGINAMPRPATAQPIRTIKTFVKTLLSCSWNRTAAVLNLEGSGSKMGEYLILEATRTRMFLIVSP